MYLRFVKKGSGPKYLLQKTFDKKNIRIYEVKKNCYITHNAYEAHTYTCLSKTGSIMVFTTGIRGGRFYEDDTYRLQKKLTD